MIVGAALLCIRQGKMLFVHTRNSRRLVYPGGIQTPDEVISDTLQRGVEEVLNTSLRGAYQFGRVHGKTEEGKPLELHLFRGDLVEVPCLRREADSLLWLTRREAECSKMITRITEEQVFPLLAMCTVW